jgi:hypothetical protein
MRAASSGVTMTRTGVARSRPAGYGTVVLEVLTNGEPSTKKPPMTPVLPRTRRHVTFLGAVP